MFESITNFFKKLSKQNKDNSNNNNSKNVAKERLHLVLMQDRANVSADFLDLMKQEIIEVIKKYIDVDETAIDVRLTNKSNEDGTTGAPALYANIPIVSIKEEAKKEEEKAVTNPVKEEDKKEEKIEEKEEKPAEKKEKEEVEEKQEQKEETSGALEKEEEKEKNEKE